jgi:hypothetical protein
MRRRQFLAATASAVAGTVIGGCRSASRGNGIPWRGAIDRLSAERRCLAPDFFGGSARSVTMVGRLRRSKGNAT